MGRVRLSWAGQGVSTGIPAVVAALVSWRADAYVCTVEMAGNQGDVAAAVMQTDQYLSAPQSGALPAAIMSAGQALVAAIGLVDGDQGAQLTKLGAVITQAMDAAAQARTAQANAGLLSSLTEKNAVSPTHAFAAGGGMGTAPGEQQMQTAHIAAANAQAARSQGGSGTAAASGKAAAQADLAKAHAAILQSPPSLADGSGTVTDLKSQALFSDTAIQLGASTGGKTNSSGTLGELFIQHVFDPSPPSPQRNKGEQPDIVEARNTRGARMDLAMAVPLTVLARQLPAFPANLRNILPPVMPLPSNAAAPSWKEVTRSMVEGRFANKDWYDFVQTKMSDEQKINEALFMQALKLYVKWNRFQVEQKVGTVLAAELAGRVDSMPGSTEREISPALSSSKRGSP